MSLYTTMAAYNNPQGLDPSEYMKNQSSTPKSVQEASLTEFVARVSADFHRSPLGGRGRRRELGNFSNRGGRPLSVQDVDESLRHRAVTLVGGGFNGRPRQRQPGTAGAAPFSGKDAKQRLMEAYGKRRCPRGTSAGRRKSQGKLGARVPPEVHRAQTEFLAELNREWVRYARDLLGTTPAQVSTSMASLPGRSSLEWVGAGVRVERCDRRPSRSGAAGILVRETPNTWSVVLVEEDDDDISALGSDASAYRALRTCVVPKKGSVLSVLIPAQHGPNGDGAALAPDAKNSPVVCIQLRDELAT
jgi:hypothetical protein